MKRERNLAGLGTPPPPLVAEPQDEGAIKQLAVTGVATSFGRSIGVKAIGLLLNLFLARILVPADFGQLALGLTIYAAFSVFANAGLGASLVRRAAPANADDLATVFGAQLGIGVVGLVIVAGLAIGTRSTSLVLAAMFLCCVPIQAPRTAAVIQMERRLDFKRLAIVDVIDCACQAVLALTFVAAGMGVYGVALAQPLGVIVGTTVLLSWRSTPFRRPLFAPSRARVLLTDGALFGVSDATNLARDLMLNWGTAAIAGVSVLGTWAFTLRLAAIPSMAIQAIGQVTYAAVPRLHAAGGSAQSVVIPTLRLTTAGLGAPVVVLAGCAPQFVPLVLGSSWNGVIDALPLTCLALLIAGPISVASAGYLFAHGRVRRIVVAQLAHSIVSVGLAFALLPRLGVVALAVGMCGAGLTDAVVLGSASLRGSDASYVRSVGPLMLGTIAIGGSSFFAAQHLDPSWLALISLTFATIGVYVLALMALALEDARRLWRLLSSTFVRPAAT